MQDYKAIDENENMSDAPAQMAKNDKAIISNFSGAEEPSTKMQGQFYFDTSENKLKFYNGSKFVAEIPCSITGTAARAKADESGRVIADSYLGKTEKAVSAGALQTLERNTAYKVGDIAYTTQLPAGYYLECVTAGITGNTEPTFKVGVILDGTAEFIAVDARAAAIFDLIYPIGSVFAATGSAPTRGTWEEIAQGRTLQGADSGHVAGTTIAAGLPNITASKIVRAASDNVFSNGWDGALGHDFAASDTKWYNLIAYTPSGTQNNSILKFDASKSNSIYGKSNTVQPPAYVVHFYRRTA
nr:MAG TPA: baseplate protein [Caudoviricetes sp.]